MISARDLEIDGEDEGFKVPRGGLGPSEGRNDAVVRPGQDMIEAAGGSEPVDSGRLQKPLSGWRFLLFREVSLAAELEEMSRWRRPAVGSGVEVDAAEGSAVDSFLPPVIVGRARGILSSLGTDSSVRFAGFRLRRAHFRQLRDLSHTVD